MIIRDSNITLSAQTQQERVQQFITDAFSVETHIARVGKESNITTAVMTVPGLSEEIHKLARFRTLSTDKY